MPINLIKEYPQLLEIDHLNERDRSTSLIRIFKRDIEEYPNLAFRTKKIWPTKHDPISMEVLFNHLTSEGVITKTADGKNLKKRSYEPDRSKRLHWIRFHIEECKKSNMEVFSAEERIDNKDVIRTYIFDKEQKYVIVLEPQRTGSDYYLLTAYYLNKKEGEKAMAKRLKKRLANVF